MSQEEILAITSSLDIYVFYFHYTFVLDRNQPAIKIAYELKNSLVYRNIHVILKFLEIVMLDLGIVNLKSLE